MKQSFGYGIIIFSVFITCLLWFENKESSSYLLSSFLPSFIQLSGLVGTVLMAVSILLASRLQILVYLFGGLDKDYRVHAFMGSVSTILLLAHPILLTFTALVKNMPVLQYYLPGNNLAYDLGILSFYSLLFSFLFMLVIKLPYHLWKYTHQVLVFTFIFGGLHGFLADSDIIHSLPLKIWMLSYFTLGVTSGFYMLFLYSRFGPSVQYTINTIHTVGDILEIYLQPVKEQIQFKPGEFIFIRFYNKLISKEAHPFSLSSTVDENMLRISVKMLGDYTRSMQHLVSGDTADIYGPFGTFGNTYKKLTPHMIWIGGGIGVAPFLSLLREEAHNSQPGSIHFFYSYHLNEGVYLKEINQLVKHTPRVSFFDWNTQKNSHLTGEQVIKRVPNYTECIILLCGPRAMMHSLEKQFLALGVLKEHIMYEDFSFI